MRNRRIGFTLTEMAVVMGMILLFIGMAIPTVRALTGDSSISMARNTLSASLVRAREEAVALQDYRGLLFLFDKNSSRAMCVLVMKAAIQDQTNLPATMLLLDAVPNRDTVLLPVGVGLQTTFNGLSNWGTGSPTWSKSAAGTEDRYLGFNPVIPQAPGSPTPANQHYYGGCILFDGNGRLVVKPYGFQLSQPASATSVKPSALAVLLGFDPNATPPTPPSNLPNFLTSNSTVGWQIPQSPAVYSSSNNVSCAIVPGAAQGTTSTMINLPLSQLSLVLFNYDTFKLLGFTDDDADLVPPPGNQAYASPWTGTSISEQTEENWLDNNSTPVMINRFDGTLIRGE